MPRLQSLLDPDGRGDLGFERVVRHMASDAA